MSVPNNLRKDKDNNNNNNENVNNSKINPKYNNNSNKDIIKHMNSNKFINRNINIIRNNNIKIYPKDKSKSISKFFINKNIQKDMMNLQNDQFINKSKDLSKEKNRVSIYQSGKIKNQQILPHIPTLSSQIRNNNNNRLNNNYVGSYNIIPLVLPFIGFKKSENRNKMI